MDLKILKEDKDLIIISFKNETHTFLQLLKKYSLDNGAEFSAYYVEHPLRGNIYFYIKGKNPKKILERSLDEIVNKFSSLEEEVEKMDI